MRQDYDYHQNNRSSYTTPGREINKSSTLRRIGAYIIDALILIFFFFILLGLIYAGGFITIEPYDLTDVSTFGFLTTGYGLVLLISEVFIDLPYFILFESKKGKGATPGKRVMSVQVVNEQGRKIGIGTSFLRNVVRLIWVIPCIGIIIQIIELILIAVTDKRIGDYLAGTFVAKGEAGTVYERGQPQPPPRPIADSKDVQQRPPPREPKPHTPRGPPEGKKFCPKCGEQMKYEKDYDEWYCYNCREYRKIDYSYPSPRDKHSDYTRRR